MMMQEHELEEGETCYKADTTFDPDTAFSYIGDKLQSLLGHHQKDFEGGFSAENLGAKYGGYGSFLPMYQRSPPTWLQPKSPKKVQKPHLLRSAQVFAPNSVVVSDATSTLRNDGPSPGISASQTLRNSSADASVAPKETLSFDKVVEAFPGKVEQPMCNLGNAPDQKPLKVRIKMGPDRVAQYNAEIYNLGLTSPSSSEGDSHDESDELMLESREIPNESPGGILKIITSPLVCGAFILSPLNEDLIKLPRENEYLVESMHEAAPSTSTISARTPYKDVLRGKEKEVNKNKKIKKPKDEFPMDLNDAKQKIVNSDDLEHSRQPLHEFPSNALSNAARESGKDAKLKNRKVNKDKVIGRAVSGDLVKDTSLEHISDQSCGKSVLPKSGYDSVERVEKHGAKISKEDVSVDLGQCSRAPGDRNCASSIYSDHSEGEGVKGAMDSLSFKVGPNSTSDKCNGIGMPRVANRLSLDGKSKSKASQTSGNSAMKADNLRDDGSAIPENKGSGKKDVRKLHLSRKYVVHTRLEQLDNPKHSTERPSSSGKPKDFTPSAAKAKPAFADKVKQKSSNQKYFNKVKPEMQTVNPAVAPVDTTLAEPVVILDNWVGCDRCQKWRLLPYGRQSNQLPDKWICSMLDWLPGMNRCDVSEDETTKAVQGLYLVPFPENQHNFQSLADGATGGAISAGAHNFNQNPQNHIYYPLNKQTLKEKQSAASTSDPGFSKGKKLLQRMDMKDEASRKVKQSLDGANTTNRSDMQHPDKSAKIVSKSNKRKSEHAIEDDASLRKNIKGKSAQLAEGKVNTTKSKRVGTGNISFNSPGLACDIPNKRAKKDMKNSMQKDATFGRSAAFEETQDLLDKVPIGPKAHNGGEASTKRVKLKDYVDNQYPVETWQNNGSDLHDRKASIKEDCNDIYLQKSKKPRVSQDEEEFKINQGDDLSKRKGAEPRIQLSVSKDRNFEKEEKVTKQSQKLQLTVEDIDKLKKDLGCEQLSMTATSSSSKVSGSRKNRSNYAGIRGSPEDSVSSSPVRMPYLNEPTTMVTDKMGKADPKINSTSTTGRLNKVKDMDDSNHVMKHEVSSNKRHSFSEKSSIKSVKPDTSAGKRDLGKSSDSRKKKQSDQMEHDKNDQKLIHSCGAGVTQEKLTEEFPRSSTDQISRKLHASSSEGDGQGALSSSKHGSRSLGPMKRSLDVSLVSNTSKASNGTAVSRLQNGTGNCVNNEAERSVVLDACLGNKKTCGGASYTTLKEAEDVWREAEELRAHADLIKNAGFSSESNYEYFKAALKFLHGASLFEACNGESIKHLEMSPMQMYSAAAKLFRTCASEYEKGHEMAAAALAYKCVEVSYLRVVYCKSSTTNRVLHDLQSNLQMVPQGESPSSSASDVDNLNNLATADKAILPKGSGSQTGNHILLPRNRPNFVRLLDFTKDVNSAMEAAKKSQETFSAALVDLGKVQNTEAIIALKRVVEFGFQNVEELVRLVLHAFNTINHQGVGGNRG